MEKEVRVGWADIAKAFSIILLVSWHANGFHWIFSYLRMPLFFLVSGYFSYNAIYKYELKRFLFNKVGNMIYLYVIWSTILTIFLYIFADRERVLYHFNNLWQVFWQPLPTLWFIYALAISFVLARVIRGISFTPIILIFSLLYFLADINISGNVGFTDKFIKLFPFFWIGLKLPEFISKSVSSAKNIFPLSFIIYFVLAWLGLRVPSTIFPLYFFCVSILGIYSVAGLSAYLTKFSIASILTSIGGATVYIYLMHRPALYYFEGFLKITDISFPGIVAFEVLIVIISCYLMGKYLRNVPVLKYTLSAPWVSPRVRVMK